MSKIQRPDVVSHNDVFGPQARAVYANLILPDFVKNASETKLEDLEGVKSSAFADPEHRLWPIHTPVDTWLSAASMMVGGVDEGPAWDAVCKAACVFDIEREIGELAVDVEALSMAEKTAFLTEPELPKHALTVTGPEGSFGVYPCTDADDVIKSAQFAYRDFSSGKLDSKQFVEASRVLVKVANAVGLFVQDLPSIVRNVGESKVPDFDFAVKCAELRANDPVFPEGAHEIYVDIAKEAAANDSGSNSEVDTYVELWRNLDSELGVQYFGKQAQLLPEQCFYASGLSLAAVEKIAKETVYVAGVRVPCAAFSGLTDNKVDARFSEKSATVVKAARDKALNGGSSFEVADQIEALGEDCSREVLNLLAAAS